MPETHSGLFTVKEFSYRRNTLRLAPDAFVTINGALGSRVLSPANVNNAQNLEVRGGLTSISVSAAVSPPGASRATLDVIAPKYKGLHEDYYVTLPNGVRIPFFVPMMEVKVYMKGRYLESDYNHQPRYYPVFWGLITGVSETYSGGVHSFSITCEDMLSWWKWQKITINPSAEQSFYSGTVQNRFPTVFMNLSPWEIIYALFIDNFFVQKNDDGTPAFYNMVYPVFSKIGIPPDSGGVPFKDTFGPLAAKTVKYWRERFGYSTTTNPLDPNRIPLEMHGLVKPVNIESIRNTVTKFMDNLTSRINRGADYLTKLDLNFNLLARIQPKGAFDLYGDGSEPQYDTKLNIAANVCELTYMEFFVDTNGLFVFKPPFYNLDVATGDVPYYRIGPEDIISFGTNFDVNNIITYLVVTAPLFQIDPSLETIGFHADFQLMAKYGVRYEEVALRYGNNAEQLRLIAAAELTRRNGMAYTGNVSIPLRPEMRLGYPIYMENIDTFYYVTGISHTLAFGGQATTDISFQYRRERVFDDGTMDNKASQVLKQYVMYHEPQGFDASKVAEKKKSTGKPVEVSKDGKTLPSEGAISDDQRKRLVEILREYNSEETGLTDQDLLEVANELIKEDSQRENGFLKGPKPLGYYRYRKANPNPVDKDISNAGTDAAVSSNELVMITDDTIPFTDLHGYRHIGAFPYGANLVLTRSGKMVNSMDASQVFDSTVQTQMDAAAALDQDKPLTSNESLDESTASSTRKGKEGEEKSRETTLYEFEDLLISSRDTKESHRQQINPENRPDLYETAIDSDGIIDIDALKGTLKADSVSDATKVQLNSRTPSVDSDVDSPGDGFFNSGNISNIDQ